MQPATETAPHPITDLDLAATYASTMSKFARRAYDVRFNHGVVTRWMNRTGEAMPKAEAFEDDFLADFDRLAVIAERIRERRAAQVAQVAA